MSQLLKRLIPACWLIVLVSCTSEPSDRALLLRCESHAYDEPRLAMAMLDSINFPESFDKELRYHYLLRQIQIRYEVGELPSELLVGPEATTYFARMEAWEYAALSDYTQGLVWMGKGRLNRSLTLFRNALNFAERDSNLSLNGLILLETGKLYLKQSQWTLAEANLRRARATFQLLGNSMKEEEAILALGSVQEQLHDYESARRYRWEAVIRASRPEDVANGKLALCQLYYVLDQKDSLNVLVPELHRSLSEIGDPAVRSDGWQFLVQWYQESGKVQEASDAKVQLNEVFNELISGKDSRRYLNDSSKLDRIRDLYGDQMRSRKMFMNGLIVLSMLIILFILYRNKRHRKALEEAESKIQTLQTMAMEFDRKEDNLRQLALKHFDILKKVAVLDGMMNDLKTAPEKKIKTLFNQAVYENNASFDWDTFFKALNPLKNGIPEKIRDFYPQLTETEYRVLILSFTGLSNKESSIILNLSTNTINSLRSSVRKKLHVPEYGDLEEFVTKQLSN